MRAAIYCRVSSEGQREARTIDSQRKACLDFAASRGWPVVAEFLDDGFSAATGKLSARKAWPRLVAAMEREPRAFDAVITWDQDRLGRSEDILEQAMVLSPFQRSGIVCWLASKGQQLDLSSMMGVVFAHFGAAASAEDNRRRRAASMRGRIAALREGRKSEGRTNTGYFYEPKTATWTHDPQWAPLIREMYDRADRGESLNALVRDLNRRGIPTPCKRGPWQANTLWQLLKNPVYKGERTGRKKEKIVLKVPPIVEPDQWARVREKIRARGRHIPRSARTRHWYLLEGIGQCADCGEPIHVRPCGPGKGRSKYECRGARLGLGCPTPMQDAKVTDAKFWTKISEVLCNRKRLRAALERRGKEHELERQTWADDLKQAEARLKKLEQNERTVLDLFDGDNLSAATMKAKMAEISRERKMMEEQVAAAKRAQATASASRRQVDAAIERLSTLRNQLANATPEQRREIVLALVPNKVKLFASGTLDFEVVVRVEAAVDAPPVNTPSRL